jgi:hypothetical protein
MRLTESLLLVFRFLSMVEIDPSRSAIGLTTRVCGACVRQLVVAIFLVFES